MSKTRVSVDGLSDLNKALRDLPKATGRTVLRNVLKKAGKPMAATMRGLAPNDPATGGDDLASSVAVSPKLSMRQAKAHRKMFKNDKASAEVFVGPGPDPAAWNQEFGNINHGPQSFARPAWDQHKNEALEIVKAELGAEIAKAAARVAKRAARAAKKAARG